jgi:lipopolysaccharide biosynthesis glycosyltransferase
MVTAKCGLCPWPDQYRESSVVFHKYFWKKLFAESSWFKDAETFKFSLSELFCSLENTHTHTHTRHHHRTEAPSVIFFLSYIICLLTPQKHLTLKMSQSYWYCYIQTFLLYFSWDTVVKEKNLRQVNEYLCAVDSWAWLEFWVFL